MADPHDTTTPGKSPAFQFYANDFVTGTIDLSAEDVGAYIRLLCYQWEKSTVPGDDWFALARITGVPKSRIAATWGRLARHFHEVTDGAFANGRLERVRAEQLAFRRRQADNGKRGGRPKATHNPNVTQAFPKPEPTRNPNKSSSVFGLQSSTKERSRDGDPIEEIAATLQEEFPALYAKCRNGAAYHTSRVNMDRDLENWRALAAGWKNLDRLRAMAEVFLLAQNLGDKNRPGTPGQLLHMAPDMDELLRKNGR